MGSCNTRSRGLRGLGVALSLAALLAGTAVAAAPPDTIPSYAMPQNANPGRGQQIGDGQGGFRRPPLAWNQLSPSQKAFLKPLKSQWDTLPPWRQHHMAEHVEQWRQLPPDRQAQVQQRFDRLAQMTPEQRREQLNGQDKFRGMAPAERQRMFNTWFQSLTPEQKRNLIQKVREENQQRRANGMNERGSPPQR
jgi:hypothetical protein